MRHSKLRLALLFTLALPVLAQAHPGHDAGVGFAAGALHPLGGMDHLMALLAVGLLAGRMRGRAAGAIVAAYMGLSGVDRLVRALSW